VVTNDNAQIAININHNGTPGWKPPTTPNQAILYFENTTGTATPVINDTYVSNTVIDMAQAMDNLYERRRVAWVKLRFIPKYTNFIQSIAEGDPPDESLTGFTNEIVYVVSDSNGLNGRAGNITDVQALLANTTGVKLKRLNREFKVFRRSRKFPFAPKFENPGGGQGLNPSGQWDSTGSTGNSLADHPHTWILSNVLPMVAGVDLFTCVFEVKFEWADLKSIA